MDTVALPFQDPAAAFRRFAARPYAMLLDSAADAGGRGRFSTIAVDPARAIEASGADAFAALERELAARRGGPGCAVGFLGYELAQGLERLPARHGNPHGLPDMVVGLYDTVAVFDHHERRAWTAGPDAGALAGRLAGPPPAEPVGATALWTPDLDRDAYMARVRRVIDYIFAGDIFQANFTQRFTAPRPAGVGAYALYERLRALSPAPFAAFLNCGPALQIASASPERFLRLSADGRVETRPIKGTRPRHADPAADRAAADELLASVKDRAENLMIVDLMRNDLARVSEVGSVKVPELAGLESFATVHHLVSEVTARLRPGLGPVDLLRAAFPGGSITGAPKVRAMEIIDELEASRRGAYCGSVVRIGYDGSMDSSIVIRTLTITPDTVVAQAGGGIVADSDPAAEWEEMLVKIRPLLAVLGGRIA
ncbi:aminodeoxychorismate synthase component I [Azospirillum sp.]|uniref:aminodeoxychorismate synthase component I n=1 Tax=Azospirillum sp. TaxID=34012 RepID=UPI003D72A697